MAAYNILFVVAEASPLIKVGGLGDVAGSLPQALRQRGNDVRIIMPRYGSINLEGYESKWLCNFSIPCMDSQEDVVINEISIDGLPVYLVGNSKYFDRMAIYGEWDDLGRFLLFSLAVMEVPKKINWKPDILHCHDWHSGIIPALLKLAYRDDLFYSSCASVFTIHNLAYQGWFDDSFAGHADLYKYMPPPGNSLRNNTYSMTGLGIYHADIVSTVSETYAKEILTPEYGVGLEMLLDKRKDSLFGILNGIDYRKFDPAVDPLIASNFDINSLGRRVSNKLILQERAGLPVNAEIPLLGMVGRVVEQKGFDIIDMGMGALDSLLPEADIQFVLQGTGETRYTDSLKKLEDLYPDKARMFLTLDFSLAQLIFAGCDIFLVPSRFEPCGLSPLIAMRYGAIPVARRSGGLAETVQDYFLDQSSGLGFLFGKYDASELLAAIRHALITFQQKDEWRKLMMRAMTTDFSWKVSLSKYEMLYDRAIQKVTDKEKNT